MNNSIRLAIFTLKNPSNCKDPNLYGIDTKYIRSVEFYDEISVQKNIGGNLVEDFCVVRGETFPVLNISKWMGVDIIQDDECIKTSDKYVMIILEIDNLRLAIPAYKVLHIEKKAISELGEGSVYNEKLSAVTKTTVETKQGKIEKLCFVIDICKVAKQQKF